MRCRAAAALIVAQALCAAVLSGGEITSGTLQIQGIALEIETTAVTTGLDIPTTIQTRFSGKTNDEAPSVEGLVAIGELTGPGIDAPIQLSTAPGYKFQVPGFAKEGVYVLQNVRLMNGDTFVAPASPSVATITVANVLQTSVKVHQLTPDELRARGIAATWDVYEYSFSFLVNGQTIVIPFPVVVDPRTHEVTPIASETPFSLPNIPKGAPPRWSPPDVIPFDLPADPDASTSGTPGQDPLQGPKPSNKPHVPAAIVIPGSLAVLHDFFAVILAVTNAAPESSTVKLEDVRATIKLPPALRVAKSNPSVAFGQPVPIVDAANGVTFLVAQSKGEAEWDVEALQPGTHTIDIEVRATLKENAQDDVPLKATPRATIVVHDPRFNLTFSHPDTIRKGVDYSTFTFLTNLSASAKTLRISNGVPSCDQAPGANVCRIGGAESDEITLASGEMKMIEYKLRPGITGHVFATAGSIDDTDVITAAVQLHMGVSESGIPLSPATLVMPYYAQFLSPALVDANLGLLGLGYSVATAPVNQVTAKFPRVIRSDVFYRAVDLARAGQRIFITDGLAAAKRDAIANLALDLLGNGVELREWDDLRRREKSGRVAGAAVIAELNAAVTGSIGEFADALAAATSQRDPYVLAVVHGPAATGNERPYAIALRGASGRAADVPNEASSGWIRDLPFADVSRFDVPALTRSGEIAIAGRWTESVDVIVTPATTGAFALEIVFPGASDGTAMRAHLDLNGTAGEPLRVPLTRGASSLNALLPNGGFAASAAAVAVVPAPLQIAGARQDLNLDPEGHKVSVLFNRPPGIQPGSDWRTKFSAAIAFDRDGVVFNGNRAIFAAAMQQDGRIVNLSFDSTLTTNAAYTITVAPLVDPATGTDVTFAPLQPKIDNDRPAGIVYGRFLKNDNTAIANAEVRLYTGHFLGCQVSADCNPFREAPQYVKSGADGTFLFEFVPRDPMGDPGLTGSYRLVGVTPEGRFTVVDGAVRLPGRVHFINLQLLGRGAAEGTAKYDNGEKVAGATVFVGSTMFGIGRQTTTDANGFFHVDDLPVGPITFAVTDAAGNCGYASGEIATPGQLATKEVVIYRKPLPGTGTVFGVIRRSDTNGPVVAARVGVFSQGFAVAEAMTDEQGRFEFRKVPAGFVTVLAAEWSVSRQSAASDFDLHNDELHEANLTLSVAPPNDATATLAGDVVRENPLFPGDPSKYERVAGAIVKLAGHAVTADSNGHFTFDSIPLSFASRTITAYDPSTKRIGSANVPTLTEVGPNNVVVFVPANSFGTGTIRVLLVSAAGLPVDGFRVLTPGFPPTLFNAKGSGVYELAANVGATVSVFAVPGAPAYGDQFGQASVHLEFPGQVASVTLRLPGQGTVRAKLHGDFDLIGNVTLSYLAWDEAEQAPQMKARTLSTSESGVAGYATFADPKVPALQTYKIESADAAFGYASQTGSLAYEGDIATHTLQLSKLSTVSGIVYAIDGKTPVAGAAVRLDDGHADRGVVTTEPDGSFTCHDIPADTPFSVRADVTHSGVYRAGIAYGRTPSMGGPVEGMAVILQRRGSIEGVVVDANNAPVPLAKVWLRELDFPQRSFGTDVDPLTADIAGRFAVSNVFIGSLRARAWDSGNPDLQGSWSGSLSDEGQTLTISIGIGAGGTGGIQVTVADPNQMNAPVPNAEVRLYRGALFDTTSTDANGAATFGQVPVGTYSIAAYSKALGRSGSSASVDVSKDLVTEARVLLEFSGKVDGTLTDPESVPPGSGVPGAAVTLSGSAYETRTSTTTSGAFSFDGVREGFFTLMAKDTESNRRASASHSLSAADPHPIVNLELERTETLNVGVYLPDDFGANSGVLAGPVSIDVSQRYGDFTRSAQGNPIVMPKLFAAEPYSIGIREIGGEQRQLSYIGSFPKGSAADPLKLVYPAYGEVEVTVAQGGAPANGARVTVSGGRTVTLFTDATGRVRATGLLLGSVSAQAVSFDGAFSGSISGTLTRQSVPAQLSIDLGAYAGVTGIVEAEAGGPSIGTRVLASFAGRTLEMITGSDGRYTFQGIPTSAGGTAVALTYIGPDGMTVGARQSATIGNDAASKVITLPAVKLDATPPQVVGITPLDGAQSVSPDSAIRFVFSEPIRSDQISNGYLQLVPADGTAQVLCTFDPPASESNGTFVITMRPPPPPAGQQYPLKSNTLYRVIVSGAIEDLTGHRIAAPLGMTFTTSDYVEPHVIKVVPALTTPVPEQVTFEFHFSEPVGGPVAFHFYKTTADGQIIAEKAGSAYLDPATGLVLFFAPNDPIEPESFYRAVFSGIHDLQGNVLAQQTFDFFSFDKTAPFVNLVSPVPDTFPLVSGVEYVLGADLRNGSADGPLATDIASVDYSRVEAGGETFLKKATVAPFAYRFVAPDAPESGITYSLRAKATDKSGNVSAPATIAWTVKPNQPPKNVAIALTPATAYPGSSVIASVSFDDEGLFATVTLSEDAKKLDGSAYKATQTKQVTRAAVADTWPQPQFTFKLPPDLDPAAGAAFTSIVTDVRGLNATASATLPLLADTTKPSINSIAPAAETTFHLGDKYVIDAAVADNETGVAEVDFTVDGHMYRVPATVPSVGTKTFDSPQITVGAKNTDTRITIVVTAIDYEGNSSTRSFEVIYAGVNDPTVPRGSWLCPVDRAVIPAGQSNYVLPLRVLANDDIAVTSVQFRVPGLAAPVPATPSGTAGEYIATITLPSTPEAGSGFTLTALIDDADPAHTVELPIAIDVVAVDQIVDSTQSITADNIAVFEGKSVLVRGTGGRLVLHVPVKLKNLIVLDGGRVDTIASTSQSAEKVDVTAVDRVYVDCASSIDVSGKGLVGTLTNAGGSHGGLGTGAANAVFDSLFDPTEAGAGGSNGAGGGAVSLRASTESGAIGRFVVAGSVRADGASASGAGSGGSIRIDVRQVIVGPAAHITANGGDSPAGGAGGGGRVAVRAAERLDLPGVLAQMEARGGNGGAGAGTIFVRRPGQNDGEVYVAASTSSTPVRATPLGLIGSGTATAIGTNALTDETRVFDRGVAGELLVLGANRYRVAGVSADGHTLNTDPADGALSGGPAYRGAVPAGRIEIGANSLARFDESFAIAGAFDDAGAVVKNSGSVMLLWSDRPVLSVATIPAAGSNVIRATTLDVAYSASSPAGIRATTIDFSAAPPPVTDALPGYPTAIVSRHVGVPVPISANLGAATLNVHIVDRADRTADTPAAGFTVVENQPPSIDSFNAIPDALYPGKNVTVSVGASDDVAVTKLSVTSTIGGASVTQFVAPNAKNATQSFSVSVPIATPGNTPMTIDAAAEDGYPGRAATTAPTKSITVLKDTIAPSVTISAPAANQLFNEGTGNVFAVTASAIDAEVGVKSVLLTVGSAQPVAMTAGAANQWTAIVPVPNVDGIDPVPVPLLVVASDYEGNSTPATIAILVKPLVDPNAPALAWTCGSTGAMYPAGSPANLRVYAKGATPSNGVQKVEFIVDGSTIPATPVAGVADQYESSYTIPVLPEGTAISVRAVATSVAGNVSDLSTTLTVVAGDIVAIASNTTIDATNAAAYDGKTIVVQSGILTVTGAHTFDRLLVLNGGTVTHVSGGGNKLDLTTTRGTFVACGASIDANGRGYVAGQTFGGTAPANAGGSHLGLGGSTGTVAPSFGSVTRPQEAGGGSHVAGGGVIRIKAATATIEGTIRADGVADSCGGYAGAGGSIWITAGAVAGAGRVQANGGGAAADGGGGAIAIDAPSIPWTVSAMTGAGGCAANYYAGAGTLLVRTPASAYGSLIVDNGGRSGQATQLPGLGRGTVQPGSFGPTLVTDRATDIAPYFEGHWVEITDVTGALVGMWRIGSIDTKTVTLLPNANESIDVVPGQTWRGIYRFDSLKLRSSKLAMPDKLLVTAPPDLDASSSIVGNNQAPPLLDASKIALQTSAAGTTVIGSAGAASDPDTPITITATNTRSGQTFLAAAAANGSFAVPVQGLAGDTITAKATDGNDFPFDSAVITVGTLPSDTPTITQISRTAWTNDGAFKAQTVALDGTIIGVASWSGVNGSSSDKFAVLDVADAAHPAFVRTISTGLGPTHGFTIANGFAYIVGYQFGTVDLRSGTPSMNVTCTYTGAQQSVAVAGGYAYTAEAYNNDGRVFVFDVSNPAAPRCIGWQLPLAGYAMSYTTYSDLLVYGARFLVGINGGASGWDVVVLDRADPGRMKMTGRLQIANFVATRGRIRGSLLYLVSTSGAEMVVVDLSNPAAPSVVSRLALPAAAGGIRVLEDTTLVAATSNGVIATTLDPAQLAMTGAAATGGTAMDVAANGGYAYVANESGLAVVPVFVAPIVDPTRIAISLAGGTATVAGSPRAITSRTAATVTVANGDVTSTTTVAADGSFTATIAASAGSVITVEAKDSNGRTAGPLPVGSAPFFTIVSDQRGTRDDDAAFFARRAAGDGTTTFISNGTLYGLATTQSSRITVVRQTAITGFDVAAGPINDEDVRSSYAFIAADRFAIVDATTASPVRYLADVDPSGREYAVAVGGNYAFTSDASLHNGTIFVYDITSPSAPKLVKTQAIASGSGVDYRKLIVSGSLLFAVSPDANRDLTIIDISNPLAPARVAELDVSNFAAFNATLAGTMLYLTGADAGVAIVDVSTPASPRVLSVIDTPGIAFAAAVSAANELAIADGALGVSFVDVTDPQHPIAMGSQALQGNAVDIRAAGDQLLVATETRVYSVKRQ